MAWVGGDPKDDLFPIPNPPEMRRGKKKAAEFCLRKLHSKFHSQHKVIKVLCDISLITYLHIWVKNSLSEVTITVS